MESRGNYLLVGIFVLAFTLGMVAFIVWLAKFQFDQAFDRYDIYFKGSVVGLSEGSRVSYRGINVGQVLDIKIDERDLSRIVVTIEIEAGTPIRVDTFAKLSLEGLTGGTFVLLEGGSSAAAPLVAGPDQKNPVIPSRPSALAEVLERAPEVLAKAEELLVSANDLLNEKNRQAVSEMIESLSQFTAALGESSGDLRQLITDAGATMSQLREAADSLQGLTVSLNEDVDLLVEQADSTLFAFEQTAGTVGQDVSKTFSDLSDTAESIADTSDELRATISENRESLREFTSGGLYQFLSFLTEARALVGTLNRLTTEFERDPARFLFGNQQEGYEAGK